MKTTANTLIQARIYANTHNTPLTPANEERIASLLSQKRSFFLSFYQQIATITEIYPQQPRGDLPVLIHSDNVIRLLHARIRNRVPIYHYDHTRNALYKLSRESFYHIKSSIRRSFLPEDEAPTPTPELPATPSMFEQAMPRINPPKPSRQGFSRTARAVEAMRRLSPHTAYTHHHVHPAG